MKYVHQMAEEFGTMPPDDSLGFLSRDRKH